MSSTCPEPGRAGRRTLIVAHRGASGYLPEHTTAAKVLAYGLGADLLEQDVIATRDRELVVLHDIHLDEVSDVALRFPGRQRPDGRHYAIDFSRAELAELLLCERRRPGAQEPLYAGRYSLDSKEFRVVSLEDEIRLIAGLNRSTGRAVGIYPEIKEPGWHAAAGIDLTRLVHESLLRSREHLTGPVFVQSFDSLVLQRLRTEFESPWPLVQLLDRGRAEALLADGSARKKIRGFASAIGLPYACLLVPEGGRIAASRLARILIDEGFGLHPYTLRREVSSAGGIAYREALGFLIADLAVDAVFCDFPDDALAVRDGSAA